MYYVYVLQSEKDNRLYIGHTNDIDKRLKRHNNGLVRSTKYRRPMKLVVSVPSLTRSKAAKLEKLLKSLKDSESVLKKIRGP